MVRGSRWRAAAPGHWRCRSMARTLSAQTNAFTTTRPSDRLVSDVTPESASHAVRRNVVSAAPYHPPKTSQGGVWLEQLPDLGAQVTSVTCAMVYGIGGDGECRASTLNADHVAEDHYLSIFKDTTALFSQWQSSLCLRCHSID